MEAAADIVSSIAERAKRAMHCSSFCAYHSESVSPDGNHSQQVGCRLVRGGELL